MPTPHVEGRESRGRKAEPRASEATTGSAKAHADLHLLCLEKSMPSIKDKHTLEMIREATSKATPE